MKTEDLAFLSIKQLAPLLAKRKLSPVEVTDAVLHRIARLNPALNAFLTVMEKDARLAARRAEREILRGRYRGPLHGVPVSLKDNVATRGARTTAGSTILAEFVPGLDATVVRRLRRAGAVLIGKTNLHEFAYGVTTNNPHYGPARNPWQLDRMTGGSSGGSAAALAAGLCYGSVGSDTGGSIRIPAALCGVVGLKPTFGRVSCYGVVPLAPSLDHLGPLARSVMDVAILLAAMAGYDSRDQHSIRRPVPDYAGNLGRRRAGKGRFRLGWPRDYFFDRVEPAVERAVEQAARGFERLGAEIEKVSLPHAAESEEVSTQIAFAEATHIHRAAGWFPARAEEYSTEVRERLEKGAEIRAVDYLRALEGRRAIAADFARALESVDAILAPTVPLAAPAIEAKTVRLGGREETVRAALIRLNRPANLIGLPAISVPCGRTTEGLPIGLQLIGRAFAEAELLAMAHAYEQVHPWQGRPSLA
jgi:aspartyl-tRNA(Asn)/glutamyl-tRNA(Gln) amidotransferase subunit A